MKAIILDSFGERCAVISFPRKSENEVIHRLKEAGFEIDRRSYDG